MNDRQRPSLLDSAAETVFLLLIVIGIVLVPLLLCEWIARLALPVPVGASRESQQSVDAHREWLAKWLFGLLWVVLGGWAMLAN